MSHRQKFEEFDAKYPDVYEMFERFTFEKIRQGYKHYSAMAVMQRVRWETEAGADLFSSGEPFKVNNNHVPYYARKFHAEHPRFDGFFRMRSVKS